MRLYGSGNQLITSNRKKILLFRVRLVGAHQEMRQRMREIGLMQMMWGCLITEIIFYQCATCHFL
jgi:hypothetical protein